MTSIDKLSDEEYEALLEVEEAPEEEREGLASGAFEEPLEDPAISNVVMTDLEAALIKFKEEIDSPAADLTEVFEKCQIFTEHALLQPALRPAAGSLKLKIAEQNANREGLKDQFNLFLAKQVKTVNRIYSQQVRDWRDDYRTFSIHANEIVEKLDGRDILEEQFFSLIEYVEHASALLGDYHELIQIRITLEEAESYELPNGKTCLSMPIDEIMRYLLTLDPTSDAYEHVLAYLLHVQVPVDFEDMDERIITFSVQEEVDLQSLAQSYASFDDYEEFGNAIKYDLSQRQIKDPLSDEELDRLIQIVREV